ncbi:hypothetical protein GDO81_029795 [Engystomops pustulosus]|uniref:Uncharacterized protein n=1 Tax=Engystomops pustulosus TaxID=76066 RepID=A0AAV6YVW4_ENGPU|nr:hypothetical protein GDO81_029795 [Engystomops pustulosus]
MGRTVVVTAISRDQTGATLCKSTYSSLLNNRQRPNDEQKISVKLVSRWEISGPQEGYSQPGRDRDQMGTSALGLRSPESPSGIRQRTVVPLLPGTGSGGAAHWTCSSTY